MAGRAPPAAAVAGAVGVLRLGFLLLQLCSLLLATLCHGYLDVEYEALVALYHATGGDDWIDNTGWITNTTHLSGWYGVTMNGSAVMELDLSNNNLKGELPPEIGNFTAIESLNLGTNFISGSIPPEVGQLSTLENLFLNENSLTGPIPPEIGDMKSLTGLWFYSNGLEGAIPTGVGNLVILKTLNLHTNLLTGMIPVHLGNLTSLFYLNLANNILTGDIPNEIGVLVSHHSLFGTIWLQDNYLTGTVPDAFTTLTTLTAIDLSDNLLTDWPDQRDESATAPPLTSSESLSPGVDSTTPSPSPSSSASPASPAPTAGVGSSTSSDSVVAIAAAAVGGVAILAGAAVAAMCFLRRRRKKRDQSISDLPVKRHPLDPRRSPSFLGTASDEGEISYSWTRGQTGDTEGISRSSASSVAAFGGASAGGYPNRTKPQRNGSAAVEQRQHDDKALAAPSYDELYLSSNGVPGGKTMSAQKSQGGTGTALEEGAGSSMLEIATAALTAVEGLAQQSFIPGVREAASMVAGLVRLAADHKSNAGDMERRVRWCRSIVLTLERAGEVLGQAKGRDGEAERVLLEDVQESIADMVQIMQSYKNKNMVSKVFVSTLCKRRQEEAEAAINSAIQRLQLGLQVRAGRNLESVGQAVEEGLKMHRKTSVESQAESKRKRRQQRLDQLEIPEGDVEITDEVLGRGGFGTVYLADYNGLNAAAKVVAFEADQSSDEESDDDGHYHMERKLQMPAGHGADFGRHRRQDEGGGGDAAKAVARSEDRQRKAFMRELEAMKRLRGPHIVHIYGAITSSKHRLVLVMELLPGGDLRYKLRKARAPLDEGVLRAILKDVCSGMAFLHSMKTVHGDLKSANVLFDAAGRAKIADFGTSLWTQHTTRLATYTTKPGEAVGVSLPWAAPEILNREGTSFKSDVYSFGMVVWECLTRKMPWKDLAGVDMLVLAVTSGERPVFPADAPADLVSLTNKCWAQVPFARPAFKQLLAELTINRAEE